MSCFAFVESSTVDALAADLQANYDPIREEAQRLLEDRKFRLWGEPIHNGKWAVHGVKWEGLVVPNESPLTAEVLARHDGLVANAALSVLMPGAVIESHRGYSDHVLRLHFTLLAPTEAGCELICGGERRSWRDRGVFVFDDTREHSAHNLTGQIRIILIVDIRRSAL